MDAQGQETKQQESRTTADGRGNKSPKYDMIRLLQVMIYIKSKH